MYVIPFTDVSRFDQEGLVFDQKFQPMNNKRNKRQQGNLIILVSLSRLIKDKIIINYLYQKIPLEADQTQEFREYIKMIVNQQFLDELKIVEALDQEGFEKSLNYSISYIAKSDTTTRLNEILEIEEDDANELLPVFLKLVSFFAKFNAGEREFKAHLEMIQLDKDKKLYFTYKMKESEKHLRKTLGLLERDNEPEYANLKWRFDLQVSSRTNDSETKPKILLQLDLLNNGKHEGNIIETDFANLKHLTEELSQALKLHNSLSQKKIQKKFI